MREIDQKTIDEVIDLYLNMTDNRISTIAIICNLSETSISNIINKYYNDKNITSSKKEKYTINQSKLNFK